MEQSGQWQADMRQFSRRAYSETIEFAVIMPEQTTKPSSRLRGQIVDLSDGGIGIQADRPLKPGALLSFEDAQGRKSAVVKWAARMGEQLHRAGLAFRADDTCGEPYPVELADTHDVVQEDLAAYIASFESLTEQYLGALDVLDAACSAPGADGEKIMSGLNVLNADMMRACAELEKTAAAEPKLLQAQRKLFLEKTDRIMAKSAITRHARTWPQGYHGDFKMLETIYKDTAVSRGFGYYIDRYGLSLPLAAGVRSRIGRLEEIVRDEISSRVGAKVLNIACGSCRELMGLAPDIARTNAEVTCIDTDGDALGFAMERLLLTEAAENITFRKYNAVRMFDDELNMAAFGKTDIIYSAGLFDYLPSEFLGRMLGALYRLLNEKGTLIAAFKDADRYRHQDFHWLVDWTGFLQRTKQEFDAILEAAGIPRSAIREERDETGIIIFYLITKQ